MSESTRPYVEAMRKNARTGPYRPEADDHLTGTHALEARIGQVLAIHEVELLYLGTLRVCRVCRTKYPCATRRLLDPTS